MASISVDIDIKDHLDEVAIDDLMQEINNREGNIIFIKPSAIIQFLKNLQWFLKNLQWHYGDLYADEYRDLVKQLHEGLIEFTA